MNMDFFFWNLPDGAPLDGAALPVPVCSVLFALLSAAMCTLFLKLLSRARERGVDADTAGSCSANSVARGVLENVRSVGD